jgi:hypothetical protein
VKTQERCLYRTEVANPRSQIRKLRALVPTFARLVEAYSQSEHSERELTSDPCRWKTSRFEISQKAEKVAVIESNPIPSMKPQHRASTTSQAELSRQGIVCVLQHLSYLNFILSKSILTRSERPSDPMLEPRL